MDKTSYADIIDALEHGIGRVEYFSSDSGIVFRHSCGTYYVASFGSSDELLHYLPSSGLAVAHGDKLASYMKSELGFRCEEPTYLYVYGCESITAESLQGIRELDESFAHSVAEAYGHEEEYIRSVIASGNLFGAFDPDGNLMAFAGFHSEGAMGMLTVLPEYRRMGIGIGMEKHLIRTALERGRKAYCNVYISNTASISLQEKLGLCRGELQSWWLWKE